MLNKELLAAAAANSSSLSGIYIVSKYFEGGNYLSIGHSLTMETGRLNIIPNSDPILITTYANKPWFPTAEDYLWVTPESSEAYITDFTIVATNYKGNLVRTPPFDKPLWSNEVTLGFDKDFTSSNYLILNIDTDVN